MGRASHQTLAKPTGLLPAVGAILIAQAFSQLSPVKALTASATGRRTGLKALITGQAGKLVDIHTVGCHCGHLPGGAEESL
jgi:hypothetical protein